MAQDAHARAAQGSGNASQRAGERDAVSASRRVVLRRAFTAAFPYTVPIMAGFVFLGMACGIYAHSLGLPAWVPTLMSVLIFAGSSEFVVASMLTGAFNPLQVFITAFIVNARHLFYGISMLERFRHVGKKRPYLVFGMCDETFSINYATPVPKGVDRGWFMFFVTLLNQAYWVAGCTLGGVFGTLLNVDASGLSFAMTALFVVIFLDQWLKEPSHLSSVLGVVLSLVMLLVFGPDNFIIPAMVAILAACLALHGRLEPVVGLAGGDEGDGSAVGDAADGTGADAAEDTADGKGADAAGEVHAE